MRVQTQKKTTKEETSIFNTENTGWGEIRRVNKTDIKKILAYSAMKIIAKPTEPYSILNPDTSSDSPSAKSKGVRLVSAMDVINQIKNKGGNINILKKKKLEYDVNNTLKDWFNIRKNIINKANLISYEIVWAIPRNPPIIA